ncbi:SGNH/GDSL hydrolase family protein [Mesobacillus zeae]|uniref:GDSL family lipase n=1 Tax=Mesobacillus zeae TaxID=1917180 RepID=A0A398B2H1_9BACI|nr:SGNH/GDSL hydrolase family protein [Mesobacillus zeae]RID84129.1 GDSL family lipase [Mesobacillus zeae]
MRKIPFLCAMLLLLTSCSIYGSSDKVMLNPKKELALELKKSIPPSFFPRKLRVVAAGDSLTEGVGDSRRRGGYLPYLAVKLEKDQSVKEVTVRNYGVSGNRTDQLLGRLRQPEVDAEIKKADIVLVTIGGNDLMKVIKQNIDSLEMDDFKAELADYQTRVESIIHHIDTLNPEAAIVLIGVYNPFFVWFSDIKEMDEVVEGWNKAGEAVIRKYDNAYFVGIQDIFQESKTNLLYTDKFHPNDKGYRLIADRVYASLEGKPIKLLADRAYTAGKGEKN